MMLIETLEQPGTVAGSGAPVARRLSSERLAEIRAAALDYMTNRPDAQILARMWLYLAACGPSEAIAMIDEIERHRSLAAARKAGCIGDTT
jgi:hypothetical protein